MSPEEGQPGGQVDPEPAATADQRAMKQCPDCAEMVLEAARKCRYCGYRFDGQQSSQASEEGLFAHLLRRAPRHLTMVETLEQLGVKLDASLFEPARLAEAPPAVGAGGTGQGRARSARSGRGGARSSAARGAPGSLGLGLLLQFSLLHSGHLKSQLPDSRCHMLRYRS